MQYRQLGRTDIEVSTVAFGCWAIAGGALWGDQDETAAVEALRAAHECGVTLFDTAEAYGGGRSEALLARSLSGVRDEILIATKAVPDHYSSESLQEACERSLRHLATDRIDLYQLHWPSRDIPVREPLATLETLREQGKIRAYGVSNFGPIDLGECLEAPYRVASNQVAYSALFRAVEYEILPLCVREQIAVLCYSPLMQGLLTGKFASIDEVPDGRSRSRHFSCTRPSARHAEDGAEAETFEAVAEIRGIAEEAGDDMAGLVLAWLLAQPGVTSVLAGARDAEQARRNARASDRTVPPDVLARLTAATERLKQALGPNADMWQSESRIR